MNLQVLLPFLAFVAVFLVLIQFDRDEGAAFIRATLGWGAYALVLSEVLSPFRAVTTETLTVAWLIPTVAAMGILAWIRRRRSRLTLPRLPIPRNPFLRFVAVGVVVIVCLTALVAWFAPPNTWDALTYHMSRIAHWAQARSIGHYATGIDAQIFMPPGAESFGLHLYLLGHGDRMVTFVQWFAMVGCLIVAAKIASRFGAGDRGQWFAAAFVATLPTGILQATSVMTDYVVALWVCIAAYEVVDLWQGRGGPAAVLELAAAAGLALATKQTALPYLLPFAAALAVILLRRPDRLRLLGWALLGLLVVGMLDLGYLSRNMTTYGNLGGPSQRVDSQANQIIDGRVLVSNLLRGASLHLGNPSPHLDKAMSLALVWIHDRMGLDINDPRTTAEGTFRIRRPTIHETRGGNLPHAVLLIGLLPLAWLVRRRLPRGLWIYMGVVALTVVVLSALFQWKPTGARYHLAFFVLMAPVTGVVLEALRRRAVADVAILVLLLSSVPWLLGNHSRPLLSGWPGADVDSVLVVPREELLFANAPYLSRPYHEIVGLLRQSECRRIGIALPGQGLEYPLWALLGSPRRDLELEWLVGGTASAHYNDPDFAPCAVVCEKCPDSWVTVRGLPEVYRSGSFRLYLDPTTRLSIDAPVGPVAPRAILLPQAASP